MTETNPAPNPDDAPADALTGAPLPAGGQPAGEPANTPESPAGPGKPLDGSPAVNTYTPREKQAAEFAAGAQDWQALVATPVPDIKLPE